MQVSMETHTQKKSDLRDCRAFNCSVPGGSWKQEQQKARLILELWRLKCKVCGDVFLYPKVYLSTLTGNNGFQNSLCGLLTYVSREIRTFAEVSSR